MEPVKLPEDTRYRCEHDDCDMSADFQTGPLMDEDGDTYYGFYCLIHMPEEDE